MAVASAQMVYQMYKEIFSTDYFKRLAQEGARVQRVLWASTSTKNPDYSDVKYVEALIGPDTVNTIPLKTLNAFRDHGNTMVHLEHDIELSGWILEQLTDLGVDIDSLTQQLEEEGIEEFNTPYDKMIEVLAKQSKAAL